ncbi:MAG: DUF4268 domain-containing protein [Ferruginibacter sp.]
MYSHQEASAIREEFWTNLGRYLSPIPSAGGNKLNWINYKTGIKNIHYKMDADKKEAIARIEINGDAEMVAKLYNLFLSLKITFEEYFKTGWNWVEKTTDVHGKIMACIYCSLSAVNIFKKEDWPQLISFFKKNIIAFDSFWTTHKEIFEMHT